VSFKTLKIKNWILIIICCSNLTAQLDSVQQSFLDLKYGMFIHYNMSTYQQTQWASVTTPGEFNPEEINVESWVQAAVDAGMKYIILTVKHHDGFGLWPSQETQYDVKGSPWKAGQGDVIQDLTTAAKAKGIKIGLYYSIWDKKNGEDIGLIKAQLTELLTNYGEIICLWFDGWGWQIPYTRVPYQEVYDHIKSIQPNCLIVNNSQERNLDHTDIVHFEGGIYNPNISETNTIPSELSMTLLGSNWFWTGDAAANNPKNPADIKALRELVNERNSNFLLNVSPDTNSVISDAQIEALVAAAPEVASIKPTSQQYNNPKSRLILLNKQNDLAGSYFNLQGKRISLPLNTNSFLSPTLGIKVSDLE